jgi:hypothetical protein
MTAANGKFEQPQFRMILQFSSRRQILRKAPGRSILRREVVYDALGGPNQKPIQTYLSDGT